MNINLFKDYYVKSDPLNYILYQKKEITNTESKRCGEETTETLGYFATIEGAVKELCRRDLRACKCTTLSGLMKEVKILEAECQELCDKIGADHIIETVMQMYRDKDPLLEMGEDIKNQREAKKKKTATKKKATTKKAKK